MFCPHKWFQLLKFSRMYGLTPRTTPWVIPKKSILSEKLKSLEHWCVKFAIHWWYMECFALHSWIEIQQETLTLDFRLSNFRQREILCPWISLLFLVRFKRQIVQKTRINVLNKDQLEKVKFSNFPISYSGSSEKMYPSNAPPLKTNLVVSQVFGIAPTSAFLIFKTA